MKLITVKDAESRPFPAMEVQFKAASYLWNLREDMIPAEFWHDDGQSSGLPGIYFELEDGDPAPATWAWVHQATHTTERFMRENGVPEERIQAWLPPKIPVIRVFSAETLEATIGALKSS